MSLFGQDRIDAAVKRALPDGLPPGKHFAVVGVATPDGIEGVATLKVVDGVLVRGWWDHEWVDRNGDGKRDDYGADLAVVL